MPSSTWVHITTFCDEINKLQPQKILDVGIGFGRWGFLAREVLDVFRGRYFYPDWRVKIDGVEIFGAYIQQHHHIFYNTIFLTDAKTNLEELIQVFNKDGKKPYDLIIFGDVLEHFEKEEALYLLGLALVLSEKVFVGIPLGTAYPQGS
jgi:hypothetical protein